MHSMYGSFSVGREFMEGSFSCSERFTKATLQYLEPALAKSPGQGKVQEIKLNKS